MSLRVTFLGTGGAVPTTERAPSAVHVSREGDELLFDCGEGTQRQMMRFGTGFGLEHIFVTHLHGDHVLGLPGVLDVVRAGVDLNVDDDARSRLVEVLDDAEWAGSAAGDDPLAERGVDPRRGGDESGGGAPYTALGLPGLVQSLGFDSRETGLTIHGPPGTRRQLEEIVRLGGHDPAFPVRVDEVSPGDSALVRDEYEVRAFRTEHRTTSVGYALVEDDRPGRFDRETAEEELDVPPGPAYGRLHDGESVTLDDGRTIHPEQVVGPPRPGRRVVYTGDTRPTAGVEDVAADADLLVHDATFASAEAGRARSTGHATAREAAALAARAGAKRLALTHVSARYAGETGALAREARERLDEAGCDAEAFVPGDGDVVAVPFPDR